MTCCVDRRPTCEWFLSVGDKVEKAILSIIKEILARY